LNASKAMFHSSIRPLLDALVRRLRISGVVGVACWLTNWFQRWAIARGAERDGGDHGDEGGGEGRATELRAVAIDRRAIALEERIEREQQRAQHDGRRDTAEHDERDVVALMDGCR
jgi:hypothetical protein